MDVHCDKCEKLLFRYVNEYPSYVDSGFTYKSVDEHVKIKDIVFYVNYGNNDQGGACIEYECRNCGDEDSLMN